MYMLEGGREEGGEREEERERDGGRRKKDGERKREIKEGRREGGSLGIMKSAVLAHTVLHVVFVPQLPSVRSAQIAENFPQNKD